jgi:replication factor C subunit 2/4
MIKHKNESWVEKFRPNKLDDIISQENIISSLRGILKNYNMPHFLFFGPSGCGKTSTILALARELFGDYFEDRVIELNASDERGIKVVRDKIKRYAQTSINKKKGVPDFKIIILDEADSMTSESQCALRKIMEDYSHITRFCIICNYYQKIIEPIVSRCSLLKFKAINNDKILIKLKNICKNENIYCSDENINNIIEHCRGDLRKSINFLQRCSKNKIYLNPNSLNTTNIINKKMIYEISGIIPQEKLDSFIDNCLSKKISLIDTNIKYFYENSYSLTNQINILIKTISNHKSISDENKSKIILKILDIDYKLNNCSNEYIQYKNLGYFILSL